MLPTKAKRSNTKKRRTMCDRFADGLSRIAASQISQSVGFSNAHASACELFGDIVRRYVEQVGRVSVEHSNAFGRSQPNLDDVALALEEIHGTMPLLEEYLRKVHIPFARPRPVFPKVPNKVPKEETEEQQPNESVEAMEVDIPQYIPKGLKVPPVPKPPSPIQDDPNKDPDERDAIGFDALSYKNRMSHVSRFVPLPVKLALAPSAAVAYTRKHPGEEISDTSSTVRVPPKSTPVSKSVHTPEIKPTIDSPSLKPIQVPKHSPKPVVQALKQSPKPALLQKIPPKIATPKKAPVVAPTPKVKTPPKPVMKHVRPREKEDNASEEAARKKVKANAVVTSPAVAYPPAPVTSAVSELPKPKLVKTEATVKKSSQQLFSSKTETPKLTKESVKKDTPEKKIVNPLRIQLSGASLGGEPKVAAKQSSKPQHKEKYKEKKKKHKEKKKKSSHTKLAAAPPFPYQIPPPVSDQQANPEDCESPNCTVKHGSHDNVNSQWIGCDVCQAWYHHKCGKGYSRDLSKPAPDFVCAKCEQPVTPKVRSKMKDLIKSLKARKDLGITLYFEQPVVDAFPEIKEHYLTVIKHPMDFYTLNKRISSYKMLSQFVKDMLLIFSNALRYNIDPAGVVHIAAKKAQEVVEQKLSALFANGQSGH